MFLASFQQVFMSFCKFLQGAQIWCKYLQDCARQARYVQVYTTLKPNVNGVKTLLEKIEKYEPDFEIKSVAIFEIVESWGPELAL